MFAHIATHRTYLYFLDFLLCQTFLNEAGHNEDNLFIEPYLCAILFSQLLPTHLHYVFGEI